MAQILAYFAAQGALSASKEDRSPMRTLELWDLPNAERRISLDLVVILKEGQEQ